VLCCRAASPQCALTTRSHSGAQRNASWQACTCVQSAVWGTCLTVAQASKNGSDAAVFHVQARPL